MIKEADMDHETEELVTNCLLALSSLIELGKVHRFKNKVFELNSFDWYDGNDYLKPNFNYFNSTMTVTWYKHIGRGMKIDDATYEEWKQIMLSCFKSLGE